MPSMSFDHALRLWIVTHRLAMLNPLLWFVSIIGLILIIREIW